MIPAISIYRPIFWYRGAILPMCLTYESYSKLYRPCQILIIFGLTRNMNLQHPSEIEIDKSFWFTMGLGCFKTLKWISSDSYCSLFTDEKSDCNYIFRAKQTIEFNERRGANCCCPTAGNDSISTVMGFIKTFMVFLYRKIIIINRSGRLIFWWHVWVTTTLVRHTPCFVTPLLDLNICRHENYDRLCDILDQSAMNHHYYKS